LGNVCHSIFISAWGSLTNDHRSNIPLRKALATTNSLLTTLPRVQTRTPTRSEPKIIMGCYTQNAVSEPLAGGGGNEFLPICESELSRQIHRLHDVVVNNEPQAFSVKAHPRIEFQEIRSQQRQVMATEYPRDIFGMRERQSRIGTKLHLDPSPLPGAPTTRIVLPVSGWSESARLRAVPPDVGSEAATTGSRPRGTRTSGASSGAATYSA